jgi:hypothetical protein
VFSHCGRSGGEVEDGVPSEEKVCLDTHIHRYIHRYIHTYIHTYIYIYIYIFILYIYVYNIDIYI